ncbi:asparaginase [Acaryochloris sp. 'Moss Beach']|uniref:asparaginase n=1 Tax=Acaryochloris sp. 'Moss Beach' TaxID=2740837 RepID=UPI001F16397F|nr:asparaginase [Acaryochloris sp. 'Moss Beach']UJB67775.1 asparaginase [Acaryochloris sp. 'Moss Beach']
MTMGKRNHSPALEIHLLREGIIESKHQAEAVVCDARGRMLSIAGQTDTSCFIRSALKPVQALSVVTSGAMEHFDLNDRDLAVMCGSHHHTVEQVRQVFNILWHCDIDPTALQCPIPQDLESPLEHNCSGKHAGMLAVCQQCQWSLHTYMDARHQVQQLILNQMAELLKMPAAEFMRTHDDCGVPTYYMQLEQIATLYAHLSAGNNLNIERVMRAMIHHPTLVAGQGQFDTDLMTLSAGELVSKSGAEGVQCVGRIGEGLGLAIKVKDGAKRAKYAVAIHLLRELGWLEPSHADTLADRYLCLSNYKRLEVNGELVML